MAGFDEVYAKVKAGKYTFADSKPAGQGQEASGRFDKIYADVKEGKYTFAGSASPLEEDHLGAYQAKKAALMPMDTAAGVKPTVLPGAPAVTGPVKNDFAAKAGRHTLPVSPVTQRSTQEHKQAANWINLSQGISDETKAYDAVIEQMEADSERFTELTLFYDFYQKDPGQWSEPELAQQAKEKMAEYETYAKKYGTFDAYKQRLENLYAAREEAQRRNYMQADLMEFAKWEAEDQQMLYRGLQAYADNEMVLVGSIERKLYDKYGKDAVERIWESVAQKQGQEKLEAAAKAGKESPDLGNTLFSLPVSWLGNILTIPYRIAQTLDGGTGRYGANAYAPFSEMGEWVRNVQAATKEEVGNWVRAHTNGSEQAKDLTEGIAEFAFGAGVQIVDNLGKAAAFGVGSLALAATAGFEEGYRQAADSGATGAAALALGVAKGALEVLTEKIPLDNLLDNVKAGKSGTQAVIDALAQGGIEATTEEINFLGGLVAEAVTLRDKSGYQQMVRQAMAQGMDYAQAREYATQQLYLMAAETAATAFVAGAGSSGITSIATNVNPGNAIAEQAQAQQKGETQESQTVGNEQQGVQGGRLTVDDLVDAIMPAGKKHPAQAAQTAQEQGVNISDLLDETIARMNGAPDDPVAAAVEGFASTGTVTNKQAADILNSARAVRQLMEQAGLKIYGLPKSEQRQAVKGAVQALHAQLAASDNPSVSQAASSLYTGEPLETVDTAVIGGYDNTNTGGVNYGAGEQNNWIESEENRGSAQYNGETQSGARTENGNRSGVPEALGRGEQIFREAFIRERHDRGLERKHIPFKDSDYAAVEMDTPLHNVQSELSREYGCKSHVIKAATWTKKAPAYAYQGEVYISEGIDGDTLRQLVSHEATHVMKQVGFVPYVEFVGRIPDMMNLNNGYAQMFLDEAATHAEVDPSSENEADILRVYDELNAAMYGAYISGDLNDSANGAMAAEAFPDLGGYLAELSGIHEQFKQEQKGKRTPAADESVGAAPSGFDPISHMQYEYGTIPEGEKAVRDDSLPVSTDGKDRVSYTARTVKGAEATPDEFADLIDKEVAKGGLSYIPIKNSDTTQKAVDTIKGKGWMQAKSDWHAAVHAGKTGADMSAMGALLLNNAANAGDKKAWLEILRDYQLLGTNTAQGLQAFRILKTLAPDDKLYMIRESVKQMVKDMHLDTDIELDEDLLHEFEEAETDEARDEVLDKITQSVADQIPSTFMDKFTALRYMNMLGNLRTQVRNIAGNMGMKAVSSAKNAVAAGLETIASKLSGGKLKRTKSFAVSKEQLSAARADFDTFRDVVLGGGKYNDTSESTAFRQRVQDKKTVFRGKNIASKGLEGYRKATNWAMEQGDLVFSKAAYARALAGYLKANGVTETDYTKVDTELLNDARLYAAKEAQEQTFRDTNWLSGWVSKIGRRKDTPAVGKLFSEGIMPFRKTPANVLVRAEEYSPLGIINSAYYSIKAMQKDSDITGAQVINSWAKTLTGSGIFALGMLLSNLGILAAGPDEDEGKEKFEELSGYQNYALQFGDISYTIDWLTPASMPLLMGAELWELIQDGGFEGKDLEQALLSIADPMIQMSMLQGIDDTLENTSYADSNWGQLAANAALSYLTQGLTNTALGQMERSFEDSRMTTYVDKESALPAWLQRAAGKASAKIPVWDYNQVPYINAWGEEEENPNWAAGLAYNMLSPGYIEKGVSDDVYKELVRLDSAQGDVNVYPASPDKTITIDKQERNLSAEQWVSLAKMQGQTARGIVEDIISSKYYSGLSDDEKAEAIGYAYDYAREHARVETLEDYEAYSAKWMNGIAGKEAEAILRKVATGEKGDVDTFAGLPIDKAAMLSEAIEELFDKPREVKPDGTSYTSVRTIQKVEAVAGSSLTEKEQQTAMEDILDDKAYEKYLKILDAGYDNDDYAESYRIVLDAEKTKTKSKEEAAIRELMQEMGLTKRQATTLYEIYEPKK